MARGDNAGVAGLGWLPGVWAQASPHKIIIRLTTRRAIWRRDHTQNTKAESNKYLRNSPLHRASASVARPRARPAKIGP